MIKVWNNKYDDWGHPKRIRKLEEEPKVTGYSPFIMGTKSLVYLANH
jgi:hypothetical protein